MRSGDYAFGDEGLVHLWPSRCRAQLKSGRADPSSVYHLEPGTDALWFVELQAVLSAEGIDNHRAERHCIRR